MIFENEKTFRLCGRILKRSLEETKESMAEPEIERYKRHVKTYGYTLGYYLMHSSDLK